MSTLSRRGGAGYRLVVAHGSQPIDRWSLPPDRSIVIGRTGDATTRPPDVDLWPDRQVSRAHARLTHVNGVWWLEDVGSKHGTTIDGRPLEAGRPVLLHPWSEITLGATTLFLAPPDWHRLTGHDLVLDLDVVGAISASLAHAELPIVPRLVARSRSDMVQAAAQLRLALEPCIEPATVALPAIKPGASVSLPRPRLDVRYDVLEGQIERARRRLTVTLNGDLLRGEQITCWLLPHNEWSTLPEHRRALATFVLPNHPAVANLCAEAAAMLSPEASAREALGTLYDLLAERWHLAYRIEPPHWAADSQKIRLPHQILVDDASRRGEGTCIDLALLVAACLENLGYQPLVAVLDLGSCWHALAGCWDLPGPGLEALLHDANRLLDGAVWVDPTGLTRDPEIHRPFAEARIQAEQCLRGHPLLFALDIAGARQEGITPLPFAGTPSWSQGAGRAIELAREQALAANGHLCSAALLAGLLAAGDELTHRLVTVGLGDADAALRTIVAALPPAVPDAEPTPGYRQVISLARIRAKDAGSPVVLPAHLLGALLSVKSVSLERALRKLGSDQDHLAHLFRLHEGLSASTSGPAGTSWR